LVKLVFLDCNGFGIPADIEILSFKPRMGIFDAVHCGFVPVDDLEFSYSILER